MVSEQHLDQIMIVFSLSYYASNEINLYMDTEIFKLQIKKTTIL